MFTTSANKSNRKETVSAPSMGGMRKLGISIHFIMAYELLENVEMVSENLKRKICGHRMNTACVH